MESNQSTEQKICSICNELYTEYGNNAWPINSGRCCDSCNELVVKHRIINFQRGLSAYAAQQWFHELKEELANEHALGDAITQKNETPKGWEGV